uniref:liver-expressed antimicrobial peptide 2-like n=1 Tax=Myxine glutinosa TaxID=7769 RepID=UPI0035902815
MSISFPEVYKGRVGSKAKALRSTSPITADLIMAQLWLSIVVALLLITSLLAHPLMELTDKERDTRAIRTKRLSPLWRSIYKWRIAGETCKSNFDCLDGLCKEGRCAASQARS